jgi:Na+-transporting NADH:ubiquinone oxidoreductase subunit NqrC
MNSLKKFKKSGFIRTLLITLTLTSAIVIAGAISLLRTKQNQAKTGGQTTNQIEQSKTKSL